MAYPIPLFELSGNNCGIGISPLVILSSSERTEKERIILLDTYTLTISFSIPDVAEGEWFCYAYIAAICKALKENPTLDGNVEQAVISGKKYILPKKPNCGESWGLVLTINVTVVNQ